jgi:hypothetical protein
MAAPLGKHEAKQGNSMKKDSQQLSLSMKDLTTRMQIDSVLQIFGMASSALSNLGRTNPWTTEDSQTAPVDSEAKIEIENTIRGACERLQKLMADDNRWSTAFIDRVEKNFEEATRLQLESLEAQRAGAMEVISPHFRYRPTLLRMVDGNFCAFLGDIDHMEDGIVGVGPTPAAAIEAFDDAFRGVTNPGVLAWLKEREQTLEEGTTQETPFPTKENNESTRNMDGGGNGETEDAESSGNSPLEDSGGA